MAEEVPPAVEPAKKKQKWVKVDPLAGLDPDLRAQAIISKVMRETHSVHHKAVRTWFHQRYCIRDEAAEPPKP